MARFLLASIGFALLQLGAPQPAGPHGLRAGDDATRANPRLEVVSKSASAREHERSAQDVRVAGGAASGSTPTGLQHPPLYLAAPRSGSHLARPAAAPVLLPRPRGPPA